MEKSIVKKQQSITLKDSYSIQNPKDMQDLAGILKKHIIQNKLYVGIAGKNYVYVEGWQFAGGLLGIFPRVVAVRDLSTDKEIKWQAEVEIVNVKDNQVISRGFATCSTKESKKKSFDEYAVLSMAQTRAIGKAYRNIMGWVMKLAGYESTPTEEMMKAGENAAETIISGKEEKPEEPEFECFGCAAIITKAEANYSKKIFKKQLCRNCQKELKNK